jgi:hypothetical protein
MGNHVVGPVKSCEHLSKDNSITKDEMKSPNKACGLGFDHSCTL